MTSKYCPQCQTTVTQPQALCPRCEAVLSLKDPYSLVGRTLLDRYQIEALVGLGGMGAVYCAFHTGIARRVAFKVLQPNIALADERLVELFEREAKVAGRLTHENIVDVKDAGRIEDSAGLLAYIVMEWLDGHTLEDELRATPQMSFAQTREILRQMALALTEAHGKNVVHRDLKPANVMLMKRANGQVLVKVLDFGIGKIINETGAAVSAVMGTPSYASPEQLQLGGKLDQRSDIYSLGVMLYRMLSGRLPFNSGSLTDLIQMQLSATPTALRSLRPEAPAALETLIHQMLAKDPALRPQTMQAVAASFTAALQDIADEPTVTLPMPSAATLPLGGIPVIPNKRKTDQTELMPDAPTPRRFEIAASERANAAPLAAAVTNGNAGAGPRPSSLIAGALLGAALAGGGFTLYRYAFNAGAAQPSASLAAAAVQASPTPVPPLPVPTVTTFATPTPAAKPLTDTAQNKAHSQPITTNERPKLPITTATSELPALLSNKSADLPLVTKPETPEQMRERIEQRVVTDLFLNAQRQYRNGNYKVALTLCNRLLTMQPNHRGAAELKQKLASGIRILGQPPERN